MIFLSRSGPRILRRSRIAQSIPVYAMGMMLAKFADPKMDRFVGNFSGIPCFSQVTASSTLAQLLIPLWKLRTSYFSFGE